MGGDTLKCEEAKTLQTGVLALRALFSIFPFLLFSSPLSNASPLDAWRYRAHVRITQPGSPGVDVAAVRVIHCGNIQPDGDDVRVLDSAGQPVPYEIAYLHPQYDALLLVRGQPDDTLTIAFGNAEAPRDPMRAMRGDLGSGPPTPGPAADGWVPRAGLVLTTMRRQPDTPNPTTIAQMRDLIAASPALDGADLVPTISHGLNPFGDSDHFISLYRGWLKLPSSGAWGFCTASNEASFSFIDGNDLVHWPGRHTEQRGKFGEKSAEHTLDAGLHYIEYAHEEVLLYQTAFLGWKPPGKASYDAIPAEAWIKPHRAEVRTYDAQPGATSVMPLVELLDSVWPSQRASGQYTRYRFTALGQVEPDTSIVWQFGDGSEATGHSVEHVYLRTGEFDVTMRQPSRGKAMQRFPLRVYPIEHLEDGYRKGRPAEYLRVLEGTTVTSLHLADLTQLAWFHEEFGDRSTTVTLAELGLSRARPDQADRADLHLLAAGDAGRAEAVWSGLAARDTAAAADHLRAAVDLAEDIPTRLELLGRLIRVDGAGRDDLAAAEKTFAQAEALAQASGTEGRVRPAWREVLTAMGDVYLLRGDTGRATGLYQRAEALNEPVVPASVRAAKVGAFAEAMEQALADKDWKTATAVIEEWMGRFPADMATGSPLFYRGKLAMMRDQPGAAVRPLTVAAQAGRGSEFEAEARYLLAQAYRQTGDDAAYRRTLRELIDTGLAGPWRERALDELKQK